jgi:peptidoglycan/LPS O-acetylase OafA/YrhL
MKPPKHIPALDGIRGIAVLMVMTFHWFQLFQADLGVFGGLRKYAVFGQTGVDLFFVLSGFLITRILLAARDRPHYFRDFYMRRSLRIFPLYYGFLLIFYLLLPLFWRPPFPSGAAWYVVYLQNVQATFGARELYGPGHFWSLAVEEHFYLLWPLLVYLTAPRRLWLVASSAAAVAVGTRMLLLRHGYGVFYFTPCRLDGLAAGAGIAWAEFRYGSLGRLRLPASLVLLIGAPITVLLWTRVGGARADAVQTWKFLLVAVLYAAAIIIGATSTRAGRLLGAGPLPWLGVISYGLYVFHPTIFEMVNRFSIRLPVLNAALAWLITIAIAFISYRTYEARFLALKRRFASVAAEPSDEDRRIADTFGETVSPLGK